MKNLTIKTKHLLIILVLLAIPFFEKADAQLINIPEGEIIDVPIPEVDDNQLVNFSINKKEFTAGEKIETKATFHNQTQQSLSGRMIVTISPLDKSFPAKPFIKEFNLSAGEKTEDFVSEMSIENWMPAGIYKAEVEIRDKNDYIIGKKFEFFEIFQEEKINNEIEATVQICADKDCFVKGKMVFGKNETVYFKLNLSTQETQINATIKTPAGEIEFLNFENNFAKFESDEIGKFSLWVNLSKEGYENRRIEREFILEEGYTEEVFESVCKINGKCDGEENEINCPEDCSVEKTQDNKSLIFLAIVLIVVVGIVVFVLVNKKKNRKKTLE